MLYMFLCYIAPALIIKNVYKNNNKKKTSQHRCNVVYIIIAPSPNCH